jgi:hypothetical protein
MEENVIDSSPIPAEAYEKYQNRWVAIRDDRVIAADDDADALLANPEIQKEDMLFHVPRAGSMRF